MIFAKAFDSMMCQPGVVAMWRKGQDYAIYVDEHADPSGLAVRILATKESTGKAKPAFGAVADIIHTPAWLGPGITVFSMDDVTASDWMIIGLFDADTERDFETVFLSSKPAG
jgi:hypothetical protein